jgi:hypothetical protein
MIKKVRVSMLLYVDEDRGIDLTNPNNWSVGLLDTRRDDLILDVNLNREGEASFKPKITILN